MTCHAFSSPSRHWFGLLSIISWFAFYSCLCIKSVCSLHYGMYLKTGYFGMCCDTAWTWVSNSVYYAAWCTAHVIAPCLALNIRIIYVGHSIKSDTYISASLCSQRNAKSNILCRISQLCIGLLCAHYNHPTKPVWLVSVLHHPTVRLQSSSFWSFAVESDMGTEIPCPHILTVPTTFNPSLTISA